MEVLQASGSWKTEMLNYSVEDGRALERQGAASPSVVVASVRQGPATF